MQKQSPLVAISISLLLSACQISETTHKFTENLNVFVSGKGADSKKAGKVMEDSNGVTGVELQTIISSSQPVTDLSKGFRSAIKQAVLLDPVIRATDQDVKARALSLRAIEAQKDFQFSGTLYGGVEDVSDQTSGLATVLSANRILFDGGKLDARILSQKQMVTAAEANLRAQINKRIAELIVLWIELDRFEKLNSKIEARLRILTPIIGQLEQVADAGIMDISQVAAAQRTVSAMKVTQSSVAESLKRAEINFKAAFGDLPIMGSYERDTFSGAYSEQITNKMVERSPALLAKYHQYLAAEANLAAAKAKNSADIMFETRLSRPFGGSDKSSDEAIGIVVRKSFYDGGKVEAEISESQALMESALIQIKSTYQEGERQVRNTQQSVKSMKIAIELAESNAAMAKDEISYLRKQLVIGGSSLGGVLAAEAELYDAESKAINFLAERDAAIATTLGVLGQLDKVFGLDG